MPYFLPTEANETQDIIEEVFSDSVVGIYLFGSAVVGGLQANSDVDVLVALNRCTSFNERKKLVNLLMAISGEIGNTSSIRPIELTVVSVPAVVPWHFPPFAEFVYGEWLREGFKSGIVPEPSSDPDLAILLKKVIDSSIVLAGRKASEVFEPIGKEDIQKAIRLSLPNLLASIKGDERNVLLTLARMWFTASNGQIASKDVAAKWVENQLREEQSMLLREARLAYLGRVKDDWENKETEVNVLAEFMKQSVEVCLGNKP